MKTDLEILIEHLQSEVDYLKSSMDECVAEGDFKGAEAFQKPLSYSSRQLHVLKCLQNPNYEGISRLTKMIIHLEKRLKEMNFNTDLLGEQARLQMETYYSQFINDKISKSSFELEKLKRIVPSQTQDDDKILALLEEVDKKKINQVEFEIIKDKIYLIFKVSDENAAFSFDSKGCKLEDYFFNHTKLILIRLGFDTVSYIKEIPNYKKVDKLKILEELAIIYFEVFGVFGKDEMHIKVEYNRKKFDK